MKVTVSGEVTVTLDNAKSISVKTSDVDVWLCNGSTASAEGDGCIKVPADSTARDVDFGYKLCSDLHVYAESATEIEVEVASYFVALHHGTASSGAAIKIDFKEVPDRFLVQNLGTSGNLYLSVDGTATAGGDDCIKIPAGVEVYEVTTDKTAVSMIADSDVEYQIVAEIDE